MATELSFTHRFSGGNDDCFNWQMNYIWRVLRCRWTKYFVPPLSEWVHSFVLFKFKTNDDDEDDFEMKSMAYSSKFDDNDGLMTYYSL